MKNIIVNINGIPTLQVNDPSALRDYVLIDVRRFDEFIGELGDIEGAKLITLGEALDHFLKNESQSKPILFICRSGARSGQATQQALSNGFKQVYNLEGGMMLWSEKNFPFKKN